MATNSITKSRAVKGDIDAARLRNDLNKISLSANAGLSRLLLSAINQLEDEMVGELESEQNRMLVDIRLTAEILCERLKAAEEASYV